MEIISLATQFHIEGPTAVAIGKFDGIHRGHRELLKYILDKKKEGNKAVVFTFDTSASSFFGNQAVGEITTTKEKRIIFEQLGIDVLVEFPLNKKTSEILPVDFVKDILLGMMNMKYIAAGDDVSFGYKGAGDRKLLENMAQTYGFEVQIIDKIKYNLKDISSTYVRSEIANGSMDVVSKLLGHPYSFAGVVESGFRLGRKLGFPTMNLYPDPHKMLPPMGVYYSNVIFEGGNYPGLTNIGIRPTVSSDEHVSVETYLYDFDKDMYGREIITELIEFKRPEIKFGSTESLKLQMNKDLSEGRIFFDKKTGSTDDKEDGI